MTLAVDIWGGQGSLRLQCGLHETICKRCDPASIAYLQSGKSCLLCNKDRATKVLAVRAMLIRMKI